MKVDEVFVNLTVIKSHTSGCTQTCSVEARYGLPQVFDRSNYSNPQTNYISLHYAESPLDGHHLKMNKFLCNQSSKKILKKKIYQLTFQKIHQFITFSFLTNKMTSFNLKRSKI